MLEMEEIRKGILENRLEDMDRRWLSAAFMELSEAQKRELLELACLQETRTLRFFCEHCHALPSGRGAEGRTLLHLCAEHGKTGNACFLMDVLGLSPTAADRKGITPMDLAAGQGNEEMLEEMEARAGFVLRYAYRNPVRRGFHPDPSVVRVGQDYYMVNSSFTYMPALPVAHSRDLVHWSVIGHVFEDAEAAGLQGLPGGFGYWAPDISYDGTWFWVAATLRRNTPPLRLQMLARSQAPEGPWEVMSFLEVDGIDPSLFTDVDGQKYLVINPGVQIAPLSEDGRLMGHAEMIWYGQTRVKSEGPHLLQREGWYYIFQAEGGTGMRHRISVARSRKLYGPYEACLYGPLLTSAEGCRIQRSGHGKPVQLEDGRWALVYLCARPVDGYTLMGRETGLEELMWTQDGWPQVRGAQPSDLAGCLLDSRAENAPEPYVCPRLNPCTFSSMDGAVRLSGGGDLTSLGDAHMLLRPQSEADMEYRAVLSGEEMPENCSAGVVGYYDERSFVFFGLEHAEKWRLVLRVHSGAQEERSVLWEGDGLSWTLVMQSQGLKRVFTCPETGSRAEIETLFLTDEGLPGKRFTGAMAGMACMGSGTAVFREESCREV